MQYVKPLEFTTGQVLGRANLGVLRDNDDFFNSLADRPIAVPQGVVRDWDSGDSVTLIAWDGWHLKRTGMDTLYYYATLTNDDAGHPTTLTATYDYDNISNDTQIFTRNTTGTSSGTLDISAFPAGLYRICFVMTRAGGDVSYDATVKIRAPYSIYTGAYSYAAPDAIVDAAVGTAANLNKWRANDIYFNAITPAQFPCGGLCRETTTISQELEIYNGYDKFHPDHRRLYYRVYLDGIGVGDAIKIYYDADNVVDDQSVTITTQDYTASYWDIPDSGYTKGDWYRVRVTLVSDGTNSGVWRFGAVTYLWMTAAAIDASYTVMDPFTVGQYVYGDTAAQLTRLDYLTDNDAAIYDRLTWGAAIPGRMDHAVAKPSFVTFGNWFHGNYTLSRRGDTLYYRTQGAELVLDSGDTITLDDYDDDNAVYYQTLDLNSIHVPFASHYVIRRISHKGIDIEGQMLDEFLEFAMEA